MDKPGSGSATTKIGNRQQITRTGGLVRHEETPYEHTKEHKSNESYDNWKDPRRIT